ncbi:hypothetical protein B0H13DRAFT_1851429 [Mycena leptocephala]|nr:hypothetical protein B0H13DRAFT_1851429 [Mycena leptocephala]
MPAGHEVCKWFLGSVGANGAGDENANTTAMHEFGARPLLPFLAAAARSSSRLGNRSRVVGAAGPNPGSRPISGASHLSSDGTGGTGGSGKSGRTVFTDAREMLSTRGGGASLHSLHQTVSKDSAASGLGNTTLAGSSASGQGSSSTLATTPPTTMMTRKPERVYAYPHGPPGLGFVGVDAGAGANVGNGKGKGTNGNGNGSVGSWDAAGLELGFARPPSNEKLGTFGSANVVPVAVSAPCSPLVYNPGDPGKTEAPAHEASMQAELRAVGVPAARTALPAHARHFGRIAAAIYDNTERNMDWWICAGEYSVQGD